MKNLDLFGKTFECSCGRTHHIQPGQVLYGEDAAERLPAICGALTGGGRAAVLMDVRTRAAAGDDVARELSAAGWEVTQVVVPDLPDGRSPICDDKTREAIEPQMASADVVVPVGSGVLSDLGKWIACDSGRPFASFATAASMNGYASSNISPTIRGVKGLLYGHPPAAVLSSPAVLREAPVEMTGSGLGDVLAKSVSSADWYLNHLLFGDYYCGRAVALIEDIEPLYLEHPERLARREDEAVAALFWGLLLTGVAMTMAETSFPSSGGEHLTSHCLDMMSSVDGVPHDLHGRQVGVGTILASELYRRVLAIDSPAFVEPAAGVDSAFWGPLADSVADEYAGKAERLAIAREKLAEGNTWDRVRESLAAMVRPPEMLRDCLARGGGAYLGEHIRCRRGRLLAAFTHAHEIRSRFTILDLAHLVGVMPAAAEEILRDWA